MNDFPNLPKSWQVKTLAQVCEKISAGGDRPNDCTAEKTQENQIPIFSNGIKNNGLYGYTKTPTITKPALTISARGTIGFVCVRYEPFFPIVRLICAIPNDKVLVLEFLAYALRYLIPQGEGSSIPQLTIPNFKQIKIPIPPLEIQRRIVKRLDEAFVRIENGTKHLKSAKDNLTKYKQSLLKSAFNGTLTNDSPLSQGESTNLTHPLAPSAREGERESCHTLKVPSLCGGDLGVGSTHNDDKDSLNGESNNLPQGWTIKTLGEVFKVVGGGTPSTTKMEFWNGKYAWITSADIDLQDFTITPKRFITDEAIRLSTTNLVEKDTIIVVTRVGLGKVGITDRQTCFSQDSQALIPLENINVKFMAFQIKNQAKNFVAVSRGTTINGITKSTLKEVKLVIPPLETQKQIVAILERHFTSADKVSAYIESCLSKAKQLKSSLLKSAFAGELT